MAIANIRGIGMPAAPAATDIARGGKVSGPSFAESLEKAVKSVETAQVQRDDSISGMVTGQVTEAHDVMIAAEEAQLSFELMLEVRNKLLEGYNQIMQMQV